MVVIKKYLFAENKTSPVLKAPEKVFQSLGIALNGQAVESCTLYNLQQEKPKIGAYTIITYN